MALIEPGMRFHFLTVVNKTRENGVAYCMVRCDCGTVKRIQQSSLCRAIRPTKSCGCKRLGLLRAGNLKHGASVKNDTPEYRTFITWQSALWRCNNPNRRDYKDYGGRGIEVCERWQKFENFVADMGIKPSRMTLGRIDNDKGYEPTNCRWETLLEQASNRRTNRFLSLDGKRMTLENWAREIGINRDTIGKRLEAGWSVEAALRKPLRGYETRSQS